MHFFLYLATNITKCCPGIRWDQSGTYVPIMSSQRTITKIIVQHSYDVNRKKLYMKKKTFMKINTAMMLTGKKNFT